MELRFLSRNKYGTLWFCSYLVQPEPFIWSCCLFFSLYFCLLYKTNRVFIDVLTCVGLQFRSIDQYVKFYANMIPVLQGNLRLNMVIPTKVLLFLSFSLSFFFVFVCLFFKTGFLCIFGACPGTSVDFYLRKKSIR